MNWTKFLTYGDSQQNAFETLCNQLFERFVRRTYANDLVKFRVINGAGGDGGIEAYGELVSGNIVAVQSKWFRNTLQNSEIRHIHKSVTTAKDLRPSIKEYIICIPHDVSSLKYGRGKKGEGKKPIKNFEEKTIEDFTNEITTKYPDLKIKWWFEKDIELELLYKDNEGVQKFWFDKEIISLDYLSKQFQLHKRGWLKERYIPELHSQGVIHKECQKVCFTFEYRKELLIRLEQGKNDLIFCITQIDKFLPINSTLPEINTKLNEIKTNLLQFFDELKNTAEAIQIGNDLYKPKELIEVDLWKVKLKLKKLSPDNVQKNILPKLIFALEKIHQYDFPQFIRNIGLDLRQSIRLILGESGTGKTQGLANCVEMQLLKNSPAIIIQAKGSPCNNWTEILSKAFQLSEWRADEFFSALETISIKNDIHKAINIAASEEPCVENTKALICIDGLEEDIENEEAWYERIRECEQFAIEYPRVKLIFSARKYFFDNTEIPKNEIFDYVFLPREGDVRVMEVAPKYFKHYNIQLPSYSLIRGIDSLFALRLFCNKYQCRTLSETDKIVTATRDLINLKIERMNTEYISSLQKKIDGTRNPILDSLDVISTYFYKNHEIEHNQLSKLIASKTNSYLMTSEINSLIDYFAKNAFLIKSQRIDKSEVLYKKKYYYNITYQSLIEYIISERIYCNIRDGSITRIPQFLHQAIMQPLDFYVSDHFDIAPNQKIIQNIVNNLLLETGKLIGDDDFLIEGFDEWDIKQLQLTAISNAPTSIAINYKAKINKLFHSGYKNLFYVLQYLILPSSYSSDTVFGAEYLHQTLMKLSVFERDKIWSGLDKHEMKKLGLANYHYQYKTNKVIFRELGVEPILYKSSLHNERPLVFAWELSTIDQELRNDLRVSLTDWAIKCPSEFLLLLKKMSKCNDPQIQEDLASIMLGVASRLKDKMKIKELALWSIENIFNHLDIHRNIIVRYGFRAIVERAFQHGVISNDEVEKSRPKPMKSFSFLPLERNLTITVEGECYPIVHDLAWYVIKDAYDNFLDSSSTDCPKSETLLNEYRKKYNDKSIVARNWGIAAGIAYIRSLGFTRTNGNWHTQATHGSKSKVFTYEEKYTWLAVHFLQGYLSDYVPAKHGLTEREFVKDYSQITDIPNPVESVIDSDDIVQRVKRQKKWVVKEVLSKELDTTIEIKDSITNWVNEEPIFDLENWLNFNSSDFQIKESNRKWIAIYNNTSLHDSKKLCYSSISITAFLIQKKDLPILEKTITSNPDSLHFITHLRNGSHSSPRTATYCNPTDIVWMNWIEENGIIEKFYDSFSNDEIDLIHTTTEIVQNGNNGESYLILPSKKVRELIRCYEFLDSELKDKNSEMLAFNHKISDGSYHDNQEIVLVENNALKKVLKDEGLEMVWFVDLFKKNLMNESLGKNFRVQKTRKYFVWMENNQKKKFKFWDEKFSNIRDKDK